LVTPLRDWNSGPPYFSDNNVFYAGVVIGSVLVGQHTPYLKIVQ